MTKMMADGRPMPTLEEKLVHLAHCMARGWDEDAAGHLCDLLEHCREGINSGLPSKERFKDLKAMVAHYGKDPVKLDCNPER